MEPATFRNELCYVGGVLKVEVWRGSSLTSEERKMTWKTPKIAEVSVGMEINMYACAVRK
jgi:coenzyme PQQ precursor peptide PqqA